MSSIFTPLIKTIASFYFATFPTNYEYPRYKVFDNAHAVCAARLKRNVAVFKVELQSDVRLFGGSVSQKVSEVHLDCREPDELPPAPPDKTGGSR